MNESKIVQSVNTTRHKQQILLSDLDENNDAVVSVLWFVVSFNSTAFYFNFSSRKSSSEVHVPVE